jgi:hypothetical protein
MLSPSDSLLVFVVSRVFVLSCTRENESERIVDRVPAYGFLSVLFYRVSPPPPPFCLSVCYPVSAGNLFSFFVVPLLVQC